MKTVSSSLRWVTGLLLLASLLWLLLSRVSAPTQQLQIDTEAPTPESAASTPESNEAPAVRSVAPSAFSNPEELVLRGSLLDAQAQGIAGHQLKLGTATPPWRATAASSADQARSSFEAQTDDQGRFEFRVPAPSTALTELRIDAQAGFAAHALVFGPQAYHDAPRLGAGLRELEPIVLARASPLLGRVRDPAGAPIAGARISVLTSGASAEPTSSDALGQFALNSLPSGRWVSLELTAEGFEPGTWSNLLIALPASQPERLEFTLHPANSRWLQARNEQGVPIPGLALALDGYRRRQSTVLETNARGECWLSWPRGEWASLRLHTLEWELVEPSSEAWITPGSDPLVWVLRPRPSRRFRVIDAASLEPVQRFALSLGSSDTWMFNPGDHDEAPLEWHANGELTRVQTRYGRHVRVHAPGYADLEIAVDGSDPQVLALQSEARLVGRVRWEAGPVEGLTLELERCARLPESTGPRWAYEMDLPDHAGRPRRVLSDAKGNFAFTSLPSGSFVLRGLQRQELGRYWLRQGAHLDVGEFAIEAPTLLRGVVKTAAGRSAAGLEVLASGPSQRRTRTQGDAGRFQFRDLEPGLWEFSLRDPWGELPIRASTRAELAPGSSQEIVLDASLQTVHQQRLRVMHEGKALRYGRIQWERREADSEHFMSSGTEMLLDENGSLAFAQVPSGALRCIVRSPQGAWLATSAARELQAGNHPEWLERIEAGQVELELTALARLPAVGWVSVRVYEANAKAGESALGELLFFSAGLSGSFGRRIGLWNNQQPAAWDGPVLSLGLLPARRLRLEYQVSEWDSAANRGQRLLGGAVELSVEAGDMQRVAAK